MKTTNTYKTEDIDEEETKGPVMQDVDLDMDVEKQFTGGFVKKELFLEDVGKLQIVDIKKNQYKRFCIALKSENQPVDEAKWVSLSAGPINNLRDLFGSKPSSWLNKWVVVRGKKWSGQIEEKGKLVDKEGVTLSIEKAD